MKIFLCGQKYFGWLTFNILREMRHDIVGVSAPVENDRGEPDRLYKAAIARDVPRVLAGGSLTVDTLPNDVDLIVAAHSYDYVGMKTLRKSKLGGIGYHPSLLPLHRGRDAVRWTIRMGDRITGGTVYWLDKNVDGGPIAAQDWCLVPPGWDATRLWRERLQPMGIRLFAQTIEDISKGKIIAIPQDNECATWEPSMDRPPIFRPDLDQLGAVDGYKVIRSRKQLEREWGEGISSSWRKVAGG